MTVPSICWQEGMFMWPHHMQQEVRLHGQRSQLNHQWDVHHNWGLRLLEIDRDALAAGRLVVNRLQARMRDGTLVDIPEEGRLPFLELAEAMQGNDEGTVHLAVAQWQRQRANTVKPEDPASNDARFLIEEQVVEDENTGDQRQTLQFRTLNCQWIVDTKDSTSGPRAGHQLLPIARMRRVPGTESAFEIDANHIPPVLACDACPVLAVDILQSTFHDFGKLLESYAGQVVSRGVGLESQSPGDALLLGHLGFLNEAVSVLRTLAFVPGIHPLTAYLELCRMVGQLAVYTGDGRAPDLPRYDHDDLGGCFFRIRRILEGIRPKQVGYVERPFVGEELRMQVRLEPAWLEPTWSMFVGVHSPIGRDEIVRLLTVAGQLDMKIGCSEHVDKYYDKAMTGLKFTPSPQPPRVLPSQPGLSYFQVGRDPQDAWDKVRKSSTLAIRLNATLLELNATGTLKGEQQVSLQKKVRVAGSPAATTLRFSLYMVPKD